MYTHWSDFVWSSVSGDALLIENVLVSFRVVHFLLSKNPQIVETLAISITFELVNSSGSGSAPEGANFHRLNGGVSAPEGANFHRLNGGVSAPEGANFHRLNGGAGVVSTLSTHSNPDSPYLCLYAFIFRGRALPRLSIQGGAYGVRVTADAGLLFRGRGTRGGGGSVYRRLRRNTH